MGKSNKKAVFAYVPVLHSGYRHLFDLHADADVFVLVGDILKKEFDYLRKDIRALPAEEIQKALASWYPDVAIQIEDDTSLPLLGDRDFIVAPDEDITKELLEKEGKSHVHYEKIFLRWHRDNVDEQRDGDHPTIEAGEFEKQVFEKAIEEAERASEWYRRIGAAIVRDGEILLVGKNRYGQSQHVVWTEGDPRETSNRGKDIDMTTSLHAERGLIAEAAKQGIALDGAEMYVMTYPCPMCAKMIAAAGIKKLYYLEGYVVLDGEDALKRAGVEIYRVTGIELSNSKEDTLPYPEKK